MHLLPYVLKHPRAFMGCIGHLSCALTFSTSIHGCCIARSLLTLDVNDTAGVADYLTRMADPLNPYGSDPVFVSDTSLYNPKMVDREAEFYNTTSGSKDVNINNSPNGFFHRPMEGMPDGFPVIIPPSTDLYRTAVLHAAMEDGNYLDTRSTSLSVQLSSYNSKLKTMAFGTATFSWTTAGLISYTVSPARTVPAFVPNASDISILVVLFMLMGVLAYLSGIAKAFPVLLVYIPARLWKGAGSLRSSRVSDGKHAKDSAKAAMQDDDAKEPEITSGEHSNSPHCCLMLLFWASPAIR